MRICLWMLALLASAALATETYRWVDENGVVHYSDTPGEGAEVVNIRPAQGYKPPVRRAPVTPDAESGESEAAPGDDAEEEEPAYELAIARPQQEETLWNLEGQLDVSLDVSPRIRRGHRLRLFLDGEEVSGLPQRATAFTVSEVWRGAHTVRVGVYDGRGRELAVSDTVRFYVQQTSTQNPNSLTNPGNPNRPGVRPPRPTPRGGG
jgi:hypothetical protein